MRAYATNSVGTTYGQELSFTTDSIPGLQCSGTTTLTDVDGNIYYTVQIGTQCWTQSNLKVSKYRNGDAIPTGLSNVAWQSTTLGAYAVYNNEPTNDGLHGKLYNHYAVMDSRGLCPTGWHVPTDGEWTALENFLGGSASAGGTLKSTAIQPTPGGWSSPNTGATNSSGFTATPGGLRLNSGEFNSFTTSGYWWSSSISSGSATWIRYISFNEGLINRNLNLPTYGFSVRCLLDSNSGGSSAIAPTISTTTATLVTTMGATTGGNVSSDGGSAVTARGVAYATAQNPTTSNSTTNNGTGAGVFTSTLTGLTSSTLYYVRAYATNNVGTAYGNQVSFITELSSPSFTCGSSTVSDVDNNIYSTVQIGSQCWTQSNLKVSKYTNGDSIPTGLNNSQWSSTTSGSYAIYDNNPINDSVFGKLYNHYAVTDSRGLCPTGWHVPTHSEWNLLAMFLDSNADTICVFCEQSPIAGGALKSTITQPALGGYIFSPTSGATNSSGFTGLPGGRRHSSGGFDWINDFAFWWTSTNQSNSNAWYRNVSAGGPGGPVQYHEPRTFGRSIRCVRDLVSGGGSATAPTITTTTATSVTTTGATTGGNVTSNGGASITARGVAYGMAQNPTISGTITNNGTGTGVFTSTLTGLTASTVYYVRAYATNSVGTSYGNEVSFTTPVPFISQPCLGIPTITDVDGNIYNTIEIGNQCWIQSNLRVSKYRNGDLISTGLSNNAWGGASQGAYSIYNNISLNDTIYGKIYNGIAATDSRGICPTGWRVPTHSDFNILAKFLDSNSDTLCNNCTQSSIIGGMLKSTSFWNAPNTGASNSSGFSAIPGGNRDCSGVYNDLGNRVYWFTSTGTGGRFSNRRIFNNSSSLISENGNTAAFGCNGFSIRCIRNL